MGKTVLSSLGNQPHELLGSGSFSMNHAMAETPAHRSLQLVRDTEPEAPSQIDLMFQTYKYQLISVSFYKILSLGIIGEAEIENTIMFTYYISLS